MSRRMIYFSEHRLENISIRELIKSWPCLWVIQRETPNSLNMASNLVRRIREVIPAPHLQAKGAENVRGEDMWLDNDDIRPLKLSDRTWNR